MKFEEAEQISLLLGTVDSGCGSCVRGICDEFNEAFPEFIWEPDPDGEYEMRGTDGDICGSVVTVRRRP